MTFAVSSQTSDRIRLFRMVRDIPYFISLSNEEQDYCCATKPLILEKLLSTIGLESRHILCRFRWADLALPGKILAKAHEEEDTHEYLEVWLPEMKEWVKVDPNWDKGLSKTGLPIAEWDGQNSTTLAVKPIKTYSPDESTRIIAEEDNVDPKIRQEYLERNYEFFSAINKWMKTQRSV